MDIQPILQELEALGTERTRKTYLQQGAHEPLFGVATGAMKPILKRVGLNQPIAEALYATGNYDAMYLAGMLAEPRQMTEADFYRWMDGAYCHMISDYIVAVTLAETDIAQQVADRWIASGKERYLSAGYSCYCWLIGNRQDGEFDPVKLSAMLDEVAQTIQCSPARAKYAMNYFVTTVGVSYRPLHAKALSVARAIGPVLVSKGNGQTSLPVAAEEIQKAVDKGRIGFKRKHVRC